MTSWTSSNIGLPLLVIPKLPCPPLGRPPPPPKVSPLGGSLLFPKYYLNDVCWTNIQYLSHTSWKLILVSCSPLGKEKVLQMENHWRYWWLLKKVFLSTKTKGVLVVGLPNTSLATKVMGIYIIDVTTLILIPIMVGIYIETYVVWVWGGVLNTNDWKFGKNEHSP